MSTIKIVISSPFWLFREGFASFITNEPGFEVVGDTLDESDLVDVIPELQPDVILLDIDHYEVEDFGKIKELVKAYPVCSIIILSSVESEDKVIKALSNGAKGFLSKKITKPHLISSLKALQKGEALLPRKMVSSIITELIDHSKNGEVKRNRALSNLTYREFEVLSCLKDKETNREIAKKLVISENTVRVHVHNILKKLNVDNRREAVQVAKRLGHFK